MTIPTDSRQPHIYPDAKTAPEPFLLICPDSVNYLTPNLACFCPDKNRPTGSKSSNFVRTGERPVRAYSRVLQSVVPSSIRSITLIPCKDRSLAILDEASVLDFIRSDHGPMRWGVPFPSIHSYSEAFCFHFCVLQSWSGMLNVPCQRKCQIVCKM